MATRRLAPLAFVEVPGTSLRRKGTDTAFRNRSPSPQQAHEDTQRHLFPLLESLGSSKAVGEEEEKP